MIAERQAQNYINSLFDATDAGTSSVVIALRACGRFACGRFAGDRPAAL